MYLRIKQLVIWVMSISFCLLLSLNVSADSSSDHHDHKYYIIDTIEINDSKLANGYKWANTPRTLYIKNYISGNTGVYAAIAAWNNLMAVNGKLSFWTTSSASSAQIEIKMENLGSTGPVADTIFTANASGILTHVVIKLNSSYSFGVGASPNYFDTQTVVMHELGHAIGIAHCHEIANTCFDPKCISFASGANPSVAVNVMNPVTLLNYTRHVFQSYDSASYQLIYN